MGHPESQRPVFLDTSRLTALGGSFWYLLSAGLMLWGIGMILLPAFETHGSLSEKLMAIGALNLYQWTLLALVFMLAVWRSVLDDAVLLTLLETAFTIAIAAALDTVAASLPMPVFVIGVGLLVLVILKLDLLGRMVIARPTLTHLIALASLFGVNFLLPGVMGIVKSIEGHGPPANVSAVQGAMVYLIESGWIIFAVAGLVLTAELERRPRGAIHHADLGCPALSSATMRWLVTLVILASTAGHLAALAWSFDLSVTNALFLPPLAVFALLAIALARGYGYRTEAVVHNIVPVCLVASFYIAAFGQGIAYESIALTTSHPAATLALLGVGLLAIASARRSFHIAEWSAAALVAAALLASTDPTKPWTGHSVDLAWTPASLIATAASILMAICSRQLRYGVAAAVAGSASVGLILYQADSIGGFYCWGASVLTGLAMLLFVQAVAERLRRSDPLLTWLLIASWLVGVGLAMWIFQREFSAAFDTGAPTMAMLLIASISATLWLGAIAVITGNRWQAAPGFALMVWAAILADASTAWLLIASAFATLIVGGFMSMRKSYRSADDVNHVTPTSSHAHP